MSATTKFGKYELIAELGQGGMADVFLAIPDGPAALGVSKLLVLKRLRKELADEVEFVTMFVDEGRLAARLSHPNVVQTYEIGEVDGVYYMTMEYLDGQPLDRILRYAGKSGEALPLFFMLRVYAEVLAGLHHAHELRAYDGAPLGVVHRDVSPQNIFVTYDGQVKVVDFGIAKARGRLSRTREGVVKGKPVYMSPEQASTKDVDRRADVFAVGLMLWETLTERRPWEGLKEIDIITRLIKRELPQAPSSIREGIDPALDAICARALAPKLDDRFLTAEEMSQAIYNYFRETSGLPMQKELGDVVARLFADRRKELGDVIAATMAKRELSAPTPWLAPRESTKSKAAGSAMVEEEPTVMPSSTKSKASGSALSVHIGPAQRLNDPDAVTAVPERLRAERLSKETPPASPGAAGAGGKEAPAAFVDRRTLVIGAIALVLAALVGIGAASLLDKPAPAPKAGSDASAR